MMANWDGSEESYQRPPQSPSPKLVEVDSTSDAEEQVTQQTDKRCLDLDEPLSDVDDADDYMYQHKSSDYEAAQNTLDLQAVAQAISGEVTVPCSETEVALQATTIVRDFIATCQREEQSDFSLSPPPFDLDYM